MCDWNQDEFMSNWDKTYVSTNLKAGAQPYEKSFFLDLNTRLVEEAPELKNISYALIVRALPCSPLLPSKCRCTHRRFRAPTDSPRLPQAVL